MMNTSRAGGSESLTVRVGYEVNKDAHAVEFCQWGSYVLERPMSFALPDDIDADDLPAIEGYLSEQLNDFLGVVFDGMGDKQNSKHTNTGADK